MENSRNPFNFFLEGDVHILHLSGSRRGRSRLTSIQLITAATLRRVTVHSGYRTTLINSVQLREVSAVPEPGSLVKLAALGAAGALVRRRRKV
jgi:hypothetical protein